MPLRRRNLAVTFARSVIPFHGMVSMVVCAIGLLLIPPQWLQGQRATISTDTGALAPGHRDFARYDTPALCLAAVQTTRTALQRTLAAQATVAVLQRTPERDTLPTGVVAVARLCSARFSMQRSSVQELPLLFELALFAQQDSIAHAILIRQLAAVSTDSARTRLLQTALDTYLAAAPARVAAAESLIGRVDAPGHSADGARLWLQLHDYLLAFWRQRLDEVPLQQEAEQIIGFVHAGRAAVLPASAWRTPLMDAYQALMTLAYVAHPDAPDTGMLAVAQRAKDDLGRIPLDTVVLHGAKQLHPPRIIRVGRDTVQLLGEMWQAMSLQQVMERLRPDGSLTLSDSSRHQPPIQAAFWFPVGPDTLRPLPGVVSLEYDIPAGCLTDYEMPLWGQEACAAPMVQLQQWQQAYGVAGLRITVVSALHGHALYSGPESPAEEAHAIAWYVRDYWHLPVTVAVRAAPIFYTGGWSDVEKYHVVVTDRAGQAVYERTYNGASNEFVGDAGPFITALLVHMVADTSAVTGAARPGAGSSGPAAATGPTVPSRRRLPLSPR